jgi:polyisoprenoid-binding protein YceI
MRTEVNIMKKILLASAGVLALGSVANANGWPSHLQNVQDYYAAALAVNVGEVSGNRSMTSTGQDNSAALRGSFLGFRGVANVNQNAGANSGLQNSVAVSYVEGCDCEVASPIFFGLPRGEANANSVAANVGQVVGNTSENATLPLLTGTTATATLDNSFNGSTGLVQVNQNAGANSLMQNATALTRVENIRGAEQNRDAWAIAVNAGQVTGSGNHSTDVKHDAAANILGSFNGFQGAANVNQNAGANSLMQNSSALASITYCNCAIEDLSTTIAAAGNLGSVTGNHASASLGSAGVSMTNSFNGATGVTQVSQNAGANSMMQNAVAIGAIYQRTN